MAWAPRYGLKGMIDASVCVKIKSDTGGSYERLMPLEFKTGKGTTGHVREIISLSNNSEVGFHL